LVQNSVTYFMEGPELDYESDIAEFDSKIRRLKSVYEAQKLYRFK